MGNYGDSRRAVVVKAARGISGTVRLFWHFKGRYTPFIIHLPKSRGCIKGELKCKLGTRDDNDESMQFLHYKKVPLGVGCKEAMPCRRGICIGSSAAL